MSYKVHTIIFNKDKNTLEDVVDFLARHDKKIKKITLEGNFYRARQLSPEYLKRIGFTEYRTITLDKDNDIKMVIAYKKDREIKGGLIMTKSKYL